MAVTIKSKSRAEQGDRLTLRISSKDKFALELLAQKEGLSLSALFMKTIERPLKEGLTISKQSGDHNEKVYVPDEAYDPLIPDRLVRLASIAPEFLTDREQVAWKVIKETPAYWSKSTPDYKKIREKWESIQTVTNKLLDQYSK